jgi:hypothetical protein
MSDLLIGHWSFVITLVYHKSGTFNPRIKDEYRSNVLAWTLNIFREAMTFFERGYLTKEFH